MATFLVIIFALTNIYISVTERFKNYAQLVAVQGIILFGIASFELSKIDVLHLVFIAAETLIFKGIIVPWLLFRIIKRNKLMRVHEKALPSFYSLLFVSLGLIICIILSYSLKHPSINIVYFTIALFSLFTGLFLMISHKKIFSHLVGFLVIENAVFLFSIAIGSEMPMLINGAILLDIFVSVLILGVFINKIGDKVHQFESDELTILKN